MNLQFFDSSPYRTLEPRLRALMVGARRVDARRGVGHPAWCRPCWRCLPGSWMFGPCRAPVYNQRKGAKR